LRREAIAAGRDLVRVEVIAVVADRADDLQPGRIVLLQLHEAAGDRPPPAWRRDVRIAAAVERAHIVLERIDTIGQRVADATDIETGRVVDINADRVEQIAAAVADAARDIVAGIAEAAYATACGDAIVVGLELIVVGAIAIKRGSPVEPVVVRTGIFPRY